MSSSRPDDSTAPSDLIRSCPECGKEIRISGRLLGQETSSATLDRLAHALCGCYIMSMGAGSLGRLLASVLASPAEPEESVEGGSPTGGKRQPLRGL